jgi:hypothetical protein
MVDASINKKKDSERCFYIKFNIILMECLFSKRQEFDPSFFYKTVATVKTNFQDRIEDYINSKDDQDNYFKSVLIKPLSQIGKLLDEISWNFDDPECIRNKHAEFSRYNDKKTQNPIGAKLNFEDLAFLVHINDDLNLDKIKSIFNSDEKFICLRNDLHILFAKLEFICKSDTLIELKEIQESLINHYSIEINTKDFMKKKSIDITPEFLTNVALFCHDRLCSNNIIELINLYKTYTQTDAICTRNSNQILNVYFKTSVMFQIGQSLREYSDFILIDSLRLLFKTNLYKIFRSDIYFYSHKLKEDSFLSKYLVLFEDINSDLAELIKIIFEFLGNYENFNKFSELYQDIRVKEFINRINSKVTKFNEKKRISNQDIGGTDATVESDERKVDIKIRNAFNNIKQEYLNISNLINEDDSPHKFHAIKFSICLIGNYLRNSNELISYLKTDGYSDMDNIYGMINDILKTRHMNARDVCNEERNMFLNERFHVYFIQGYKKILDNFIRKYDPYLADKKNDFHS